MNLKLSHHVYNGLGQFWCKNYELALLEKEVTTHQKKHVLSILDDEYLHYLWLKKHDGVISIFCFEDINIF